ncbi:MAG TPA: D-glycero-beta-D-manno-heptose-7-phosphate kinase [Xanthobacteraceae bacterium]|nr:D-glycero-beta-D-manno-heptose-7-phosphate kinase [Xanthobacteraceae bacterium]
MFDFEHRLSELAAQTVLCVGDLMLDEFVYGEVSRISPEASTPVIAVSRQEVLIGGAGNVARNIAALGARCLFVGIIGEDDAGRTLLTALQSETGIEPHLVIDPSRPTTRKVRFVSERHSTHLLRADWELAQAISPDSEKAVIAHTLALLPKADAVVLSDYAKGVLTLGVIRAVIDAARRLGKPVVVDPKGTDYAVYRGATLITPNRMELAIATRRPAVSDDEIASAAAELGRIVDSEAVLATRSDEGMTLVVRGAAAIHVPGYPVKVRDVSGAGDTAVAVLAALLAMDAGFEAAARAANAAAAVVVGKRGTATVSVAELRSRILPAASLASEEKIVFDWSTLDDRLDDWRRHDLRIGFTNGCFDILHPGHIKVLTEARAACDRLVVGLNSDASVVRLKGEGRPIQNEQSRAVLLAALEAVDLVVVFTEDTPLELIRHVRPTVLVKGGDYRHDDVVGHELVEAAGGVVVLIDVVPGFSTTRIIDRSRRSDDRAASRPADKLATR